MKLYISADIEGIAGIAHFNETNETHAEYTQFQRLMTRHVAAACAACNAAGADTIVVNDAHGSGRNLRFEELPENVQLIRGWSAHPLCMVQEIDAGFDALIFIGYHAPAGSARNPLAHTLSTPRFSEIRLNGEPVAEYHLHALAGALHNVPTIFLSGDDAICAAARAFQPAITTVPTFDGIGGSIIARHPARIEAAIRSDLEAALRRDLSACRLPLPSRFDLEITYGKAADAYRFSFYPGSELIAPHVVRLQHSDYFEILRALNFMMW
jgi:D-amino peptidase